jgi:hypothetical protein
MPDYNIKVNFAHTATIFKFSLCVFGKFTVRPFCLKYNSRKKSDIHRDKIMDEQPHEDLKQGKSSAYRLSYFS